MNIEELIAGTGNTLKLNAECSCGRIHSADVREIIIEQGALARVPGIIKKYGGSKVFVVADSNTYAAAGKAVCGYLKSENLPYTLYVYGSERIEPDETTVGKAVLHYECECDFNVGIG